VDASPSNAFHGREADEYDVVADAATLSVTGPVIGFVIMFLGRAHTRVFQ
jgi:hypothetical protein